jgi:hypothetical protein
MLCGMVWRHNPKGPGPDSSMSGGHSNTATSRVRKHLPENQSEPEKSITPQEASLTNTLGFSSYLILIVYDNVFGTAIANYGGFLSPPQ